MKFLIIALGMLFAFSSAHAAVFPIKQDGKNQVTFHATGKPPMKFSGTAGKVYGSLDIEGTSVKGELKSKWSEFRTKDKERDKHMMEHVGADKHPEIILKIDSYTISDSPSEFKGTLSINGTTKPISGKASVKDGLCKAEFMAKITDFGMKRPKMLVYTVDDDIKIEAQFSYP